MNNNKVRGASGQSSRAESSMAERSIIMVFPLSLSGQWAGIQQRMNEESLYARRSL